MSYFESNKFAQSNAQQRKIFDKYKKNASRVDTGTYKRQPKEEVALFKRALTKQLKDVLNMFSSDDVSSFSD